MAIKHLEVRAIIQRVHLEMFPERLLKRVSGFLSQETGTDRSVVIIPNMDISLK